MQLDINNPEVQVLPASETFTHFRVYCENQKCVHWILRLGNRD